MDLNSAMIAATIANAFSTGSRTTVADMVLEYGPQEKPTAEEIEGKARFLLRGRLKESKGE